MQVLNNKARHPRWLELVHRQDNQTLFNACLTYLVYFSYLFYSYYFYLLTAPTNKSSPPSPPATGLLGGTGLLSPLLGSLSWLAPTFFPLYLHVRHVYPVGLLTRWVYHKQAIHLEYLYLDCCYCRPVGSWENVSPRLLAQLITPKKASSDRLTNLWTILT